MINSIDILKKELGNLKSKPAVIAGYWTEITNDIALKGRDKLFDGKMYPLVIISADFKENYGQDLISDCVVTNVKIYVITEGKLSVSLVDRLETTYKNTLYPITAEIVDLFNNSYCVQGYEKGRNNEVTYELTRFPYLNKGNKEQNMLNSIVDAVEINFKSLRLKTI